MDETKNQVFAEHQSDAEQSFSLKENENFNMDRIQFSKTFDLPKKDGSDDVYTLSDSPSSHSYCKSYSLRNRRNYKYVH